MNYKNLPLSNLNDFTTGVKKLYETLEKQLNENIEKFEKEKKEWMDYRTKLDREMSVERHKYIEDKSKLLLAVKKVKLERIALNREIELLNNYMIELINDENCI